MDNDYLNIRLIAHLNFMKNRFTNKDKKAGFMHTMNYFINEEYIPKYTVYVSSRNWANGVGIAEDLYAEIVEKMKERFDIEGRSGEAYLEKL